MISADALALWEEVKENNRKLSECKRHEFEGGPVRLGQKMICKRCGGSMQLVAIGEYISGYEAAGKSADDIWPGYRSIKRIAS